MPCRNPPSTALAPVETTNPIHTPPPATATAAAPILFQYVAVCLFFHEMLLFYLCFYYTPFSVKAQVLCKNKAVMLFHIPFSAFSFCELSVHTRIVTTLTSSTNRQCSGSCTATRIVPLLPAGTWIPSIPFSVLKSVPAPSFYTINRIVQQRQFDFAVRFFVTNVLQHHTVLCLFLSVPPLR